MKRSQQAVEEAGIDPGQNPAVVALADFAYQRSGIEPGNYYQTWQDRAGVKAYREEVRSIQADMKRFKRALDVAGAEGVTDREVLDAAPHAFSGRLEWRTNAMPGHWEYTTGQYFPTEYRKAAATVLEVAINIVRRSRPAAEQRVTTIAELEALNERNGGHFFESQTIRFFNSRIESGIIGGRYFVTSEAMPAMGGKPGGERRYSVRSFDSKGNIQRVGEFHKCATLSDARQAIRELEKHTPEEIR
jgi:hypothetical protein